MATLQVFILSLLTLEAALLVHGEIACQDLQEEILCSEANEAGNCYQYPWSGICRKTCGRCDECYDAHNLVTCEDEMEKGNCGDVEIAHICSQTCQTLSCSQEATKRQLAEEAMK